MFEMGRDISLKFKYLFGQLVNNTSVNNWVLLKSKLTDEWLELNCLVKSKLSFFKAESQMFISPLVPTKWKTMKSL